MKQSKLKVISPLDKKTVETYKHAIGIWMCTDMQPYNSVERKGFKHLLSVLCPNFELPSRKYFSDHKIPQMYEIVRNCLKEKLKQVSYISLTTDCWTSVNGYPFIGLTAHTINNDWKIESFCLACTALNVDHNSVNIKNKIKQILIDWEIDESKIAGITTDCGSNILKAVESLSFNHIPCFGHVLNTCVNNAFALPPVKLCSENAVKVRSVFHYSPKMKRSLLNTQINLSLPPLVVPSSCETRWWSLLPCLNFIKTQHEALRTILTTPKHQKILPTFNHLQLIERLLCILNPLKQLREAMASEKNVTISSLWPIYQQLKLQFYKQTNKSHSQNVSVNEAAENNSAPLFPESQESISYNQPTVEETSDFFSQINDESTEDCEEEILSQTLIQALNHVEQLVSDAIFNKLSKRFNENIRTKQLIQLTSFLDPRYKSCLTSYEFYMVKQRLVAEMELNGMKSVDPSSSPPLKKKSYSGKVDSFFM